MVLPKVPQWGESTLQGVTYWVGYRRLLYDGYHIPEAALVTETCALIAHHLPRSLSLSPEVLYRDLLSSKHHARLPAKRMRADLVVFAKPKGGKRPRPAFAIEVKRAAAPTAEILEDLERLAVLKHCRPRLRCLLFLFSEQGRPSKFVKSGGGSAKGMKQLSTPFPAFYRVRRTLKAAPRFSDKDIAHYACLIEVFLENAA